MLKDTEIRSSAQEPYQLDKAPSDNTLLFINPVDCGNLIIECPFLGFGKIALVKQVYVIDKERVDHCRYVLKALAVAGLDCLAVGANRVEHQAELDVFGDGQVAVKAHGIVYDYLLVQKDYLGVKEHVENEVQIIPGGEVRNSANFSRLTIFVQIAGSIFRMAGSFRTSSITTFQLYSSALP